MKYRYLCRGKRLDNGELVQGQLLVTINDSCRIVNASKNNDFDGYEIDPATLGQCTGLKDKRGRLIFEGDVLQWPIGYTKDDVRHGFATWDSGRWNVSIPGALLPLVDVAEDDDGDANIVGSVHDNPKLIKGDCK